jgi:hypothetical protein
VLLILASSIIGFLLGAGLLLFWVISWSNAMDLPYPSIGSVLPDLMGAGLYGFGFGLIVGVVIWIVVTPIKKS